MRPEQMSPKYPVGAILDQDLKARAIFGHPARGVPRARSLAMGSEFQSLLKCALLGQAHGRQWRDSERHSWNPHITSFHVVAFEEIGRHDAPFVSCNWRQRWTAASSSIARCVY